MKPYRLPVQRINDGKPIITPQGSAWESGVTFNATAIYLPRSEKNDAIILKLLGLKEISDKKLDDGVVAIFYRARPKQDPGYRWSRSYIGLAIFTPMFELLKRFPEPILSPANKVTAYDGLGVEDPRITRIDDTFYCVYCGVADKLNGDYQASICLARSTDLFTWEKLGPVQGEVNFPHIKNKDGVLFPEKIEGKYFLLHRPYHNELPLSDFSIHLAMADSLPGVWKNCGEILHSFINPECCDSWVGAGSVPIPIGDKKYLVIYHIGNFLKKDKNLREYDLGAAIFDFNNFSEKQPAVIVDKRLEPLMVPETKWEIEAPYSDSVANVVFICGSYEYKGDIYLIYGGGDTYTLAAKVNKQVLLEELQKSDSTNPYIKNKTNFL
ncbi:MAG: hypothetical protein N3A72_01045 [bacterium]|nr:hypothetical protein [bacterium]